MKAIILSAGKPEFGDGPISNLTIHGERLLDIQISCLRSVGVEDILLAVGYRAEDVQRADIEIRHSLDWRVSGSLSSLALFVDIFDSTDDVLLVYGDTLFEPRIIQALSRCEEGIAIACFLDRSNRDLGRYREYAKLEAGALVGITQDAMDDGVRTVFTGLVLVRRQRAAVVRGYIQEAAKDRNHHLGRLLDLMVRHGMTVSPVIVEHGWAELSCDDFYQDALSKDVFLERVIQIRTDWAARARRYDKLDWVNDDHLLLAMVEIARQGRPRRVLDLGTGTGKVLLAVRHAIGSGEFWGIDTSQAMLDKIPDQHGLTLNLCNAESLEGVPDSHFDLVTARMVFHHIGEVHAAMRSISRVLRPGGRLILCEGVPPSLRTVRWYTEMFRYKEDRHTLTEGDIIHMYVKAGFNNITTKTVTMERASLNNWLDNSGIPQRNIDVIKELHFNAPPEIVEDYDMKFADGDCLMTWRFAVVAGTKTH